MSVDQFIQLMVEDPELRQRLVDAGSNDERAAMVAEHGIEIPTQAQVTARIAELQEMADIDGGGSGWCGSGLTRNHGWRRSSGPQVPANAAGSRPVTKGSVTRAMRKR